MPRKSDPDLNKICKKCNQTDRGPRGDCRICNKLSAAKLRAKRAIEKLPCLTCSQTNWTKKGTCRTCLRLSQKNKSSDPCTKCGGRRNAWGACFACKREDERTRNGMQGAHGNSGVGEICEICNATLEENGPRKYALDHDHDTGIIRGWLCICCNAGLGSLGENPQLLRRAADYIERHLRLPELF